MKLESKSSEFIFNLQKPIKIDNDYKDDHENHNNTDVAIESKTNSPNTHTPAGTGPRLNLLRDSFLRNVSLLGVDDDIGNDNLALTEGKESSENGEQS